jgi:hypothetical protein
VVHDIRNVDAGDQQDRTQNIDPDPLTTLHGDHCGDAEQNYARDQHDTASEDGTRNPTKFSAEFLATGLRWTRLGLECSKFKIVREIVLRQKVFPDIARNIRILSESHGSIHEGQLFHSDRSLFSNLQMNLFCAKAADCHWQFDTSRFASTALDQKLQPIREVIANPH